MFLTSGCMTVFWRSVLSKSTPARWQRELWAWLPASRRETTDDKRSYYMQEAIHRPGGAAGGTQCGEEAL